MNSTRIFAIMAPEIFEKKYCNIDITGKIFQTTKSEFCSSSKKILLDIKRSISYQICILQTNNYYTILGETNGLVNKEDLSSALSRDVREEVHTQAPGVYYCLAISPIH